MEAMIKQVVLTPISEQDLENITDYLFEHWGTAVTEKFIVRFEEICRMLSLYPKMFPLVHKRKNIRKCVLTQRNSIYYREQSTHVEILTIFDTRQSQGKLRGIIKSA